MCPPATPVHLSPPLLCCEPVVTVGLSSPRLVIYGCFAPLEPDHRFVEDTLESPPLGAWGLRVEVW